MVISLTLTRPDSKSTRAETVFPQAHTHMTCDAHCHVTYRSTTLPENRALRLIAQVSTQRDMPDGIDNRSTPYLTQDSAVPHILPTILRTCEGLSHTLFPEVKSTIEIENRRAVDASLSLSEISDAHPTRQTDYPPCCRFLGPPLTTSMCILVYPQAVV